MVQISTLVRCLLLLNCACCCMCIAKSGKKFNLKGKGASKGLRVSSPKITTVSLTQKGYIQFLRYMKKVPVIEEFTFCIWMKSDNLTYPHPIFSYSRNSKLRLIRVWITPKGKDINLAITEIPIFKVPFGFKENRWYHICTSWDGRYGSYGLFINGKVATKGVHPKLKNFKIPGGGDIVVGQEFTDADKGLDDGIEGTIFGFNLVLSSAIAPPKVVPHRATPLRTPESIYSYNYDPPTTITGKRPLHQEGAAAISNQNSGTEPLLIELLPEIDFHQASSDFSRLFPASVNLGTVSSTYSIRRSYGDTFGKFPPGKTGEPVAREQGFEFLTPTTVLQTPKTNKAPIGIKRTPGAELVELSFNHCSLGRGSPLDTRLLFISWTQTTVRVFGGALLKKVHPFC